MAHTLVLYFWKNMNPGGVKVERCWRRENDEQKKDEANELKKRGWQ